MCILINMLIHAHGDFFSCLTLVRLWTCYWGVIQRSERPAFRLVYTTTIRDGQNKQETSRWPDRSFMHTQPNHLYWENTGCLNWTGAKMHCVLHVTSQMCRKGLDSHVETARHWYGWYLKTWKTKSSHSCVMFRLLDWKRFFIWTQNDENSAVKVDKFTVHTFAKTAMNFISMQLCSQFQVLTASVAVSTCEIGWALRPLQANTGSRPQSEESLARFCPCWLPQRSATGYSPSESIVNICIVYFFQWNKRT